MKRARRDWVDVLREKYAAIIESVSDERGQDQGVWFDLRPNLQADPETHQVHEYNEQDAKDKLSSVSRCDCGRCDPAAEEAVFAISKDISRRGEDGVRRRRYEDVRCTGCGTHRVKTEEV